MNKRRISIFDILGINLLFALIIIILAVYPYSENRQQWPCEE
jgi:hypothetical protein